MGETHGDENRWFPIADVVLRGFSRDVCVVLAKARSESACCFELRACLASRTPKRLLRLEERSWLRRSQREQALGSACWTKAGES